MIITINKIYNNSYIYGVSQYGDIYGRYFGKNLIIGSKCNVELEISKVFTLDDFRISNDTKFCIFTSNGITTVNGLVHEIDYDMLYILFDFDLIAIEISLDFDYQTLLNKYVSFTFDDLKLYDSDLIV